MLLRKFFTVLGLCFFFVQGANAQFISDAELYAYVHTKPGKHEKKHPEIKKKGGAVPYYYRHHRKLSAGYTGYVIELTKSDFPLRRDHKLFRQFGNVHYDNVAGEGYSYVIKINFASKKAVKKFLKDTVRHRAPEARVVEYKMGGRKS